MAFQYTEELAEDLEGWKFDHDVVMKCRNLEDRLTVVNALLGVIPQLEDRRHTEILSGSYQSDPYFEGRIRQAFRRLSRTCSKINASITRFERREYEVQGSTLFRSHREAIEKIFQEMTRRVKLAKRVGLSGVTLDEQSTDQFNRMLDDPSLPAPRSKQGPLAVPMVSLQDLLRNRH
jgi:hypothetical protein